MMLGASIDDQRSPSGGSAAAAARTSDPPLLQVQNLRVRRTSSSGGGVVVDGVDLSIGRGRTLGVVGESGCGKSVTALSILRLLPPTELEVFDGSVVFEGRDMLRLGGRELRRVRGRRIGVIFQDPMTSLNPVLKIGLQITESIRTHTGAGQDAAVRLAHERLEEVRMPRAGSVLDAYPHELSGGMRQRVMIAIAISCNPAMLIADEPTTALDVTVQADVLDVLRQLTRERGMAMLMITHDIGVLAEMADETVVMYAGQVVERAATRELLAGPEHPYTEALLGARPNPAAADVREAALVAIEGHPPTPDAMPAGCRFAPRCPHRNLDGCHRIAPELRELRPGHWVRSTHPASERTDRISVVRGERG